MNIVFWNGWTIGRFDASISWQALNNAKKFASQVAGLDRMASHDLFSHTLPLGWNSLASAKGVKAEGLLRMALEQISKAKPGSANKWARDVIRGVLGDVSGGAVPEDCVHQVLLKEARAFLG